MGEWKRPLARRVVLIRKEIMDKTSFMEYYKFNTEIAPDRIILIRTEKKSEESFQEYAQRWHELAA